MNTTTAHRATVYLLPILFLAGCAKLGEILKGVDLSSVKPTVHFDQMKLKDIDFQKADVAFVFDVANPNPFDIAVDGFSWDLALADQPFLDGTEDKGLALEANGTSKVRLPVTLTFQQIIDTAKVLKGTDEVPFTLGGDFTFDTKFGPVKVPYKTQGNVPVLRVPKVKLKGARVASLKLLQNKATIEVDVGLAHEQGKSLSFDKFDYKLKLAGNQVADGLLANAGEVAKDGEQVLTLPINLNLLELGSTVVKAVKNKEPVDIGLNAGMDVVTPWGPIPLTVDKTQKLQLK